MKKPRIYIDTSVIGGCFDEEFATWSNGLVVDFQAGLFRPILSDIVAAEVNDAPERVREKFKEILGVEHDFVANSPEATELADGYQARKILPPKYYADCLHIALATVAEADLLVSWNFKHIVRFEKIRLFNAVSLELGYKPLQIYSPREVSTVEGG
ncbi:MAG TPA: PIN domain protein [Thermoanaerobaculia bacterium]|nr:PIN domain protein [Thermoanaerobaculia bacterium]